MRIINLVQNLILLEENAKLVIKDLKQLLQKTTELKINAMTILKYTFFGFLGGVFFGQIIPVILVNTLFYKDELAGAYFTFYSIIVCTVLGLIIGFIYGLNKLEKK
jgi:hypothetical protein